MDLDFLRSDHFTGDRTQYYKKKMGQEKILRHFSNKIQNQIEKCINWYCND